MVRSRRKSQSSQQRDSSPLILFLLLVGGTMIYAAMTGPELGTGEQKVEYSSVAPQASMVGPSQFERRVETFRADMERRIEQERVRTMYENQQLAPGLQGSRPGMEGARRPPESSLFLSPERHVREGAGAEGHPPLQYRYPDAQVQYHLKETQEAQVQQQKLREEYIREIMKNAKAAGVRVRIDKDDNLELLRSPQSVESGVVPVTPQTDMPAQAK